MTTYAFTPSSASAPQFTPTLDGSQYIVKIIWSLFGQRYYAACFDLSGNQVFNIPVIESPVGIQLSTLVYNATTLKGQITTLAPHGYQIGATMNLTITGAVPTGFNGVFQMLVTGPSTLAYPFSNPPALSASTPGVLQYDIDLAAGYFSSILTFRNNVFTVTP